MSFRNYMGMRDYVHAYYHCEETPKCEKAFMTTDAFRVLLRSIGSGSRKGRIANEDGVQLYGWRVIEKDGSLSAIITDVVESSHKSQRTSVTFDVDYEYAIHRDRYLRDLRNQKNFNLLGYIHSHPGHMTYFSQTDVDTMAEYTRSDMEVMLSGLVTLNDGMFELTMYAVTQKGNTMDIWHLPLMVSDKEVARRMPASMPKSFEQVWCEASGANTPPDFSLVEIETDSEPMPQEPEKPQAAPDTPEQTAQTEPDMPLQPEPNEPERTEQTDQMEPETLLQPEQDEPEQTAQTDRTEPDAPRQPQAPGSSRFGFLQDPPDGVGSSVPGSRPFSQNWQPARMDEAQSSSRPPEPVMPGLSGELIDVEDAVEGEHGFLYRRIQNGRLQMQILSIPIDGIPTVLVSRDFRARVDPPLYLPHEMTFGFCSGEYGRTGRIWGILSQGTGGTERSLIIGGMPDCYAGG